jgi:hypothetical protein
MCNAICELLFDTECLHLNMFSACEIFQFSFTLVGWFILVQFKIQHKYFSIVIGNLNHVTITYSMGKMTKISTESDSVSLLQLNMTKILRNHFSTNVAIKHLQTIA